ncbi:diguanylate cyclase [Spongiibacter sp. KMU-158]|uniref:Diguanylate cyclase n=1 Tax=Spongiibacter pelagi TaxID=2760804 RepID=A0A927C0T2_9GAMM|nr:diguanylate cyclase [Spongiibacter pelagi]
MQEIQLQTDLKYRRNLLTVMAFAGFFGGVALASINIAREMWVIVTYELIYAAYSLIMARFTRTATNLTAVALLLVIPFFSIVLFAISIQQTALTICMWILTIPIVSYLFLGSRLGLAVSVIYVSAGMYLYFMRLKNTPEVSTMTIDLNVVVSTLAVMACAHFYEAGRERAQAKLIALAGTDPLTGLANRMRLEQEFKRLRYSSKRYQMPLSLAVIDLDFSKKLTTLTAIAVAITPSLRSLLFSEKACDKRILWRVPAVKNLWW